MSFLLHTSGSVGAPGEQSPGATRPFPFPLFPFPAGGTGVERRGHERMVNSWAASGEERIDFSAGIARFGA